MIRLRPELHKDQRVHLDVGVTLSSVKDVETAHFPMGDGKQPIAVQVPEVTTMRVQSSVEMELDQFLAFSIPAMKTDKKGQPSCILVNVRKIEGPFVAGATDSAEADTREISPAHPLFAPDEIVAKVGEKVIRYGEIKPTVDLMLELVSAHAILVTDEKPLDAHREELTKAAIERAVQRKLLVAEFRRNLPRKMLGDAKKQAEMESKLNRQIQVAFYSALEASNKKITSASGEEIDRSLREQEFITRLALLMRVRRLRNFDQLDTALQELGTSLQQQIDEFGEQLMGLEAVWSRMPRLLDQSQRQDALQQALRRIRAATTVWTIYDDPS